MEKIIRNYEMFSKSGNKACQTLVNKMEKRIKGAKRITEDEVNRLLEEGVNKIRVKHSEVRDTEPEYHIRKQVEKFCEEVGYDFEIYF